MMRAQTPKVRVDEQVVRKILKVNPALRAGRTTAQVKGSLERGEPLVVPTQAAPAQAPAGATSRDTAQQLRETIAFFLGGKAEALAATKSSLREQVLSFVSLLDRRALDAHGLSILAEHSAVLRELGLDPRNLINSRKS